MLKKSICLTLFMCCLALPAAAANQSGALSLSLLQGKHLFEGNQSLETSRFRGVGLGYNFTENWSIEGIYTKAVADTEDPPTPDTKVETYRLDVLYHFRPDKKFIPYVAAGMGAIYSSPDVGADRDHLLVNYGVGFKYFILDNLIALRADIRHLVDIPEPDNNLQYTLGLTFQLGKAIPASKPATMAE
ncbi:outer membrane beta-barrel domain-containing protein [uncultured Desulfuromusa sp.]|uniref:outer membrane beta-barrel domain-containing protein n=1 Tax=uncultured Desulfuromusa sp. TaxID=219183 RepID=UPI002AA8226F|nr:outer membrane beta-barrel domain-containing protein [uncultured Desulfuromusa sp.]